MKGRALQGVEGLAQRVWVLAGKRGWLNMTNKGGGQDLRAM